MELDDVAARARRRELVRRGYDAISLAYRSDDGAAAAADVSRYAGWIQELAGLMPARASGCFRLLLVCFRCFSGQVIYEGGVGVVWHCGCRAVRPPEAQERGHGVSCAVLSGTS